MSLDKATIIKYRLERAYETIEEAKILGMTNHWNTVANRLYYACFYAVIALLFHHDFRTKSHDGVRIILSKEFIKNGILPKELGSFYGELFNKRQESDYKDIKRFTQEEIEPLISKAEQFIEKIKSLLVDNL
jgi:uncharacterized protein (UPF0332 family)